jgi:DNA invertase Pin-like site-specific DNA recombinase
MAYRTVAQVEAELIALRAAAERAGVALACVFASSAEYEADLIRERRAAGVYRAPRRKRNLVWTALATAILAAAFLML